MPVCGARGTKSEGERSTGLDPQKEQADPNRATARPVKSFSPSRPGIKKGIFPSPTVSDGRPGASLPRPATAPLAKSAGPVTPNLARGGEAPHAAPPAPAQAPTTRHRRSSQCRGGAPTQNMEYSGAARHRSARDATPTRQQGDEARQKLLKCRTRQFVALQSATQRRRPRLRPAGMGSFEDWRGRVQSA